MEIVVLLPRSKAVRAALTRVSDSASRADVASCQVSLQSYHTLSNYSHLRLGSRCLGS